MDKPVYLVRKFDLIGKVLYTFKLLFDVKEVVLEKNRSIFVYKDNNRQYPESRLFTLTTDLSKYDKNNFFKEEDNKFLPYFANVTEDLPGNVKFKPKTYKNCQLMSEKHGGYLQFYYKPENLILRIAINSNTYIPIS